MLKSPCSMFILSNNAWWLKSILIGFKGHLAWTKPPNSYTRNNPMAKKHSGNCPMRPNIHRTLSQIWFCWCDDLICFCNVLSNCSNMRSTGPRTESVDGYGGDNYGVMYGHALCITGHLWGESSDQQWIPLTKVQWCLALVCFLFFILNKLLNNNCQWLERQRRLCDATLIAW